MNKVVLTVYVLVVDEERLQMFCRIDQHKQPLCCEVQKEHLGLLKPGTTVTLLAELHSRDIAFLNPCDCHTTSNRVESYLTVLEVRANDEYCNEVVLDHVVAVQNGKLVHASDKTFQTIRVRLPEKAGYATVTIPDTKMISSGTTFNVGGTIKAKDFEKYTICPCCRQENVCQQLSLLVRGFLIKPPS